VYITRSLVIYTDQHRIVRVVKSKMLRRAGHGLKRYEMLTGVKLWRENSSKAARYNRGGGRRVGSWLELVEHLLNDEFSYCSMLGVLDPF
jgi:hypothetical protein